MVVIMVIVVIVIVAASAKKKKLNSGENNSPQVVLNRESSQNTPVRRSEKQRQSQPVSPAQEKIDVYSTLLYYVSLDGVTYGPFGLDQLKTYPLLEDTLITTNTLNGTWYEAKYFECLDELFLQPASLPFRIDADGTIILLEEHGVSN